MMVVAHYSSPHLSGSLIVRKYSYMVKLPISVLATCCFTSIVRNFQCVYCPFQDNSGRLQPQACSSEAFITRPRRFIVPNQSHVQEELSAVTKEKVSSDQFLLNEFVLIATELVLADAWRWFGDDDFLCSVFHLKYPWLLSQSLIQTIPYAQPLGVIKRAKC